MEENFKTILTNLGRAKLANAVANRTTLQLKGMAVGDGGGAYYDPSEDMTALRHETYRRDLNDLSIDENNPAYVI